MAIVLARLQSVGPDLPPAQLKFDTKRSLVRGPSDTGKSYIRDCLWYLLGGDRQPKPFPLSDGYQELQLRFRHLDDEYEVRRSLRGGAATVYIRPAGFDEDTFEAIDEDIGELLVRLSGAAGMQILRSQSDKGPVTGDDVRHWSLLSQTAILSEEPTSGSGFGVPKRIASFNLFLTGSDDTSIQLRKSTAEVERIKGQLTSAEDAYRRIQAGLPSDVVRADVSDALERVDAVLSAMTSQYEARAARLKQLRTDIGDSAQQLSKTTGSRDHSASMIARFELLEQKYSNDIDRLSATDEGVAFFSALAEVPCPLCGTPTSQQIDPHDLKPGAPTRYREAIAAEVEKIRRLRSGLVTALDVERRRFALFRKRSDDLASHLRALQKKEAAIVNQAQIEFSADPKTLAVRRSELSAQVAIFDEMERLAGEIERLKKSKVRRRIQVDRDGGSHGRAVADLAKSYLHAWGFTDIQNISLDAEQCDLVLNDRPRLSYGAGRRALYLAALIVALMENALSSGHPHLGAVVIDSPLKAYADPAAQDADTVTLATVVDRFYEWLSEWDGRGQIVVLENEKIDPHVALRLGAIEFTGIPGVGRQGFYPWREVSARDDDKSESDATDGN